MNNTNEREMRNQGGIFISYIHEDQIVATALKRLLVANLRVQVFVAGDRMRLGDEWLSKIRKALKSARVILAVFSPPSIRRPWVNFEAGGAWFSDGKTLVPICIGGLKTENLPKPYSNIQGINLDNASAARIIVQDLWKVLKCESPPPPPFNSSDPHAQALSKALSEWQDRWETLERARGACKRLTGEELPEDH